ncbi:MAG: hypothetical protein NUV67_03325, partial [archaeon]|nr:hypothetical protein [archaeon]
MLVFAYWVFTNASFVSGLVEGYGLLGLFIAAIIANATIFLPVPIDFVILAVAAESGSLVNVLVLSIVAGCGAAIGEMTAYIMGLMGVKAAEQAKHKEFQKVKEIQGLLGSK